MIRLMTAIAGPVSTAMVTTPSRVSVIAITRTPTQIGRLPRPTHPTVRADIRYGIRRWDRTNSHEFDFKELAYGSSGAILVYWKIRDPCGNNDNRACFDPVLLSNDHISDSTSVLEFESDRDWHFGSSSPTPSGKGDLRGLAAHEAGHAAGLGHGDGTFETMVDQVVSIGARSLNYYDKKGRCQINGHSHGQWGGGCGSYGGSS